MPGGLRPFHSETQAASSIYFETILAYFADVIKRTFGVALQEILEPWRPGELSPAPAAASNNTPHKSKLHHLTVRSFPTASTAIILASFSVPQLVSGVGGLGGRSSRYGVGMTGKWQGKSSSSKIVWGPLANCAWAHESGRQGFKPHLHCLSLCYLG